MSTTSRTDRAQAGRRSRLSVDRRPYTFLLDPVLVEQARQEVGELDVVRSIEAALVAAIDYQVWVREVARKDDSDLE